MNISTEAAQKLLPVAAFATKYRKSTTLPILGFVKLATNGNELTATACNLEVSHAVTVRGLAGKEWATCAPSDTFFDLLRSASGANIELGVTGKHNNLRIETEGPRRAILKCMPAEEFPLRPQQGAFQIQTEMDGVDLAHGLQMAARAASTDAARPQLESVLFEVADERLTFVGSDGYQFARNQLEFPAGHSARACWPRTSAMYVAGVLKQVGATVQMDVGEKSTSFSWGENSIFILHTEVDFPDVNNAFPVTPFAAQATFQATITLSAPNGAHRDERRRAYLLPELARARTVAKDGNAVQKVKLAFGKETLEITAETETNSYAGKMDHAGDQGEFVFDLNQILPALRLLRSDRVKMSTDGKIVRFDSVDDTTETFAVTCLEG